MTTTVLNFKKEKETKNTIRFEEIAEGSKPPVIKYLYLAKWFIGDTTKLKVTIETE